MKDIIIAIKRIGCLALVVVLFGCNTAKLPAVSNKLEPAFKAHEKIYKQQDSWRHVQWEYKYSRKVIDSIFTEYNLQDSEEFYIIQSINDYAQNSFEIKSLDKNIYLQFNQVADKPAKLPNDIEMSYSRDFKDFGGNDFYEFVKNISQEELEACHKKAPVENSKIVLFTYYNKGSIIVKRFETCNYSEYYNWEIPTEEN